jgi:hypothetical protein
VKRWYRLVGDAVFVEASHSTSAIREYRDGLAKAEIAVNCREATEGEIAKWCERRTTEQRRRS